MTLANGQTWQKSVTVTENQVGSYWVVFELYTYNSADGGTYQFTYDYCVLPIQVVSSSLSFLVSFRVFFLDCDSVDVVVGAERYDFHVRRNVVDDAAADAVNIEVVVNP